jgi:DNA (cytosine-5)-methyltransferase 1
MARLVVPDGTGLRRMTLREGLRMFGYPEWFELPVTVNEGFDLLGNTVAVAVVKSVVKRLAAVYEPVLI